jgi:SAM-dependent methyltransferase
MTGLRREVIGRAAGRVIEVGAGTGLNIPHYGNGVQELVLTEPEPTVARRLERRARRARLSASVLTVFAERLPFDNASFDNVVVTLVLCTVANPAAALQEARRVLVDGGGYFSSSTSGPPRDLRLACSHPGGARRSSHRTGVHPSRVGQVRLPRLGAQGVPGLRDPGRVHHGANRRRAGDAWRFSAAQTHADRPHGDRTRGHHARCVRHGRADPCITDPQRRLRPCAAVNSDGAGSC